MLHPSTPSDAAHEQVQKLLPWFVTDRLPAAERAAVADHVAACAECQAELASEQALQRRVSRMTSEVDHGWMTVRAQIQAAPRRDRGGWTRLARSVTHRPRIAATILAAQAALLVGGIVLTTAHPPSAYHALGAAAAPSRGNLIVMAQPDMRAGELADVLAGGGARIVDGPTASGAFVVAVDRAARPAMLARLRRSAKFSLVEPLDP